MINADHNLHVKIQAHQLGLLQEAVLVSQLIQAIAAGIYAFVLWDIVDLPTLKLWLTLTLATAFTRLALFYWQWNLPIERKLNSFKCYLVIGNFVCGLLWGASTIWFFPEQFEYQLFMLFMLGGIALGSSLTDTNYLPGYYAYLWTSLFQLVIGLLIVGEKIQIGMGVITIFFIGAISVFGRATSRTLYESIRLRFENDELVQRLEEKTLIAEKANASKSKFLATASHDLRQPLHTSSLLLDALRATLEKNSQYEILDKLVTSQDRLTTLFDALLDISNLDSGSVKLEFESVSVAQFYLSLVEENRPVAEKKGLELTFESGDFWIKTDPILITRIIGNLLSNAIRYTHNGSIRLTAKEEGNGQILLSVIDTGVGISKDHHQRIFHEFEQLNNSHRDYRLGLGLGLSIVKRLSDLLDHKVNLVSKEGQGSTFTIRCEKGAEPEQTAPANDLFEEPYFERTINILFVDDESSIREAMSLVLGNFNVNVMTAESTSQAINMLDDVTASLDVIIADFRLKDGETGFDVIDQVREFMHTEVPAIIITGEVDLESISASNRNRFAVAQKPISSAALMPLILNAVNDNNA